MEVMREIGWGKIAWLIFVSMWPLPSYTDTENVKSAAPQLPLKYQNSLENPHPQNPQQYDPKYIAEQQKKIKEWLENKDKTNGKFNETIKKSNEEQKKKAYRLLPLLIIFIIYMIGKLRNPKSKNIPDKTAQSNKGND